MSEAQEENSTFVITPHEYLRAEILSRGFHDQSDSSLLDIVQNLEYETALLVAHVLDTRIHHNLAISDEELASFILTE